MINNIMCMICKDIIEDSKTRMTSYISCIEEVSAKKFPVKLPSMTLGTTWMKDSDAEEKMMLRIKIIFPNSEEKILLEPPEIKMTKTKHRLNCTIEGLPLTQEGVHRFVVEKLGVSGWEFAATASFISIKRND
ncbi:MAG: hypothetical protein L6416_06130 [Candidatus Omnitrophica bacterium]|nr:hypothetical protein [Candidatus Omnitrophota bacterium]